MKQEKNCAHTVATEIKKKVTIVITFSAFKTMYTTWKHVSWKKCMRHIRIEEGTINHKY
jgi:hypothetical protein